MFIGRLLRQLASRASLGVAVLFAMAMICDLSAQSLCAAMTVDDILDGIKSNRGLLRTYKCQLAGSRWRELEGKSYSVDFSLVLKTDHDRNLFLVNVDRLNQDEATLELVDNRRRMIWVGSVEVAGTIIYRPESSIYNQQNGKQINIQRPASRRRLYDIRAAGLLELSDFDKFRTLEQMCDVIATASSEGRVSVIEDNGSVELHWRTRAVDGLDEVERVIEVNPKDGYLVTAVRDRLRHLSRTAEETPGEWQAYHSESTVEWKQIDGITVPITWSFQEFDCQSEMRKPVGGQVIALTWTAINNTFDSDEFTVEALDSPKGSRLITDSTGGTSRILQLPYVDQGVVEKIEGQLAKPVDTKNVKVARNNWLLVILNGVIVAILGCVVFMRRKKE